MLICLSYGEWLLKTQKNIKKKDRNYDYIEYYRKAYENMANEEEKRYYYFMLIQAEATRDFHTGSIREIDHLIQLENPNCDLKEPECDLYRISISFQSKSMPIFIFSP